MSQFEFTIGQWHGLLEENTILPTPKCLLQMWLTMKSTTCSWTVCGNMTGIEFTLPSVDEWQYAAHGGVNNETTMYVGSNDVNRVAWYKNNSSNRKHAINDIVEKEPNTLDLFAMSGNVSELCNTPYPHQMAITYNGLYAVETIGQQPLK